MNHKLSITYSQHNPIKFPGLETLSFLEDQTFKNPSGQDLTLYSVKYKLHNYSFKCDFLRYINPADDVAVFFTCRKFINEHAN